ncbi:MAG: UDP-N-acetylglucosamine 2-epimerase [Elusimicrobia bacterium]|nr:UDP-N-acetylglucosamine 2-epimerase [Candidatus Obscuribacterium magneticum]MCB4755478.1 UDP-N-acetylglucosamine 2-epimerase [Candidatus Obscuribacterium magneticum]
MRPKNVILFLYMVAKTGHQKAAEAIMEAVSCMDPRVDCVSLDAVNHAYPLIGNVFYRMYIQMLKRAPVIWDYLYDNPDVEEATRDARGLLTLISSFRTQKILREYHPLAVVCTQAVPAIAMASEKKRGKTKVPLICVITDYGVHSYWIHPEIDLYLVAHEDIRKDLVNKGIDPNRIRVTGIPIMPRFGETTNQIEARTKLRLNPAKKTLLVTGGSHGLGSLDKVVDALKTIPMHFQMMIACGSNHGIHRKILKLTRGMDNVHVYGYVKDLTPMMSAADILITKPGGLTCSEALALQLPLIVTNPIPGQEERNVNFLLRHHVAALARTSDELIHAVSDLLRHPKKIMQLRARARLVSKPYSAWESARLIFDLINRRGTFSQKNGE